MIRDLPEKFLTRFSVMTLGRLIGASAVFLSSLLIARQMGAEALGEFSIILAVVAILSVIISGGFPAIAMIFTAEYSAIGRDDLLKGFVQSGRKQVFFGAALCLLLALGYLSFASPFAGVGLWTTGLIILIAIAHAITVFHGAILVGLQRQVEGLLPDTLIKPLAFLILVTVAAVFSFPLDASGLLVLFVLGVALACTVAYFQVQRSSLMRGDLVVKDDLKRWRHAAYPWIVTSLVWDLFIELHIILAGVLASAVEVAVLHVAFRFRVLAGFGMRSLYLLYLPNIVSLNAQKNNKEILVQLKKVNSLAFAYVCMVILLFMLTGSFLMGLFGTGFEQGWVLLLVVSSTLFARAVFGPAPIILAMQGHQKVSAVVMVFCLGLSLGGSLLLYPVTGILGIALSYGLANFIGSVTLWILTRNLTGINCALFAKAPDKTSL